MGEASAGRACEWVNHSPCAAGQQFISCLAPSAGPGNPMRTGTVSDWLNRLLPHLPIPCFQLEAGCIDPVALAEQGFPPTFFTGSWSLWEFNERHRVLFEILSSTKANNN